MAIKFANSYNHAVKHIKRVVDSITQNAIRVAFDSVWNLIAGDGVADDTQTPQGLYVFTAVASFELPASIEFVKAGHRRFDLQNRSSGNITLTFNGTETFREGATTYTTAIFPPGNLTLRADMNENNGFTLV